MYKNLSHIQKLEIAINRRNKKRHKNKKKILKSGSKLLKKYNYYIYLLVFIILYMTIKMHVYLDKLSKAYFNNSCSNIKCYNYHNFLDYIYYGGITISLILAAIYIYAFSSYMFYPMYYKKNKREIVDPIIINFIYFFVLSIEVYFKEIDWMLGPLIMLALFPIIGLLYFLYRKITLYVKSYIGIILKSLFFSAFAFFTINSQHVIFSFQLITNDLKNNFENKINEAVREKKQKVISKIAEKINKE